MKMAKKKQTKIEASIELDLSKVPDNKKSKAKRDVAEYIEEETLVNLAAGKSIVKGERFKKLNKEYAKEFKNGNTTPNLLLDGDMLDSFTVRPEKTDSVLMKIGARQRGKADGHCNFSKESKLPQRRFIPNPDENQKLKSNVDKEIKRIIKGYSEQVKKVGRPPAPDIPVTPTDIPVKPVEVEPVSIDLGVGTLLESEFNLMFEIDGKN